jgi:hypothetical protein
MNTIKIISFVVLLVCMFGLGVVSTNIYAQLQKEQPLSTGDSSTSVQTPQDRIKESQIKVYSNRVVLDVSNPEWASFTATGSMEPVLNEHSNAIEVIPKTENEIGVGDIISYKSEYATGIIIHRVVYKGQDEKGTYFVLKGDNNPTSDPGKIRFSQIQRVVVAIIY